MPISSEFDYRRYKRYFIDLRGLYKRKEIIVYTGLTLTFGSIAFFGVFAIRPTILTITNLIKETQSRRIIVDQLQTKINNLGKAQNNYVLLNQKITLVDNALPQNANLAQLIYQFEGLSSQYSLQINNLTVDGADLLGSNTQKQTSDKNASEAKEIVFNIKVLGSFDNLSRFLKEIEGMRRTINLTGYNFVKTQAEGEENPPMSLTIDGKAFYKSKI